MAACHTGTARFPKCHAISALTRRGLPASLHGGGGGGDIGGLPYTEEELSLNVRRALKELRQDFRAPPAEQQVRAEVVSAIELKELPTPAVCANVGAEGHRPLEIKPTTLANLKPGDGSEGPKQYVVDYVNGKVRVMAVPTSTTVKACETVQQTNAEITATLNVGTPSRFASVNQNCLNSDVTAGTTSPRLSSRSALASSSYESCSSTTDAESVSLDFNGGPASVLESVVTWARSPRDNCAPHPIYYFTDGSLELQVEGSLYKLHRHFFEHYSSFFVALFMSLKSESTAQTSSPSDSGIQLQSPIHLPDITTIDFDRLLSVIYPMSFASCGLSSMEEWISVLNLSSRLEFASIRDLAVNNIAPMASAIDKALLGRRHGVKSWVMGAYSELCTREKPLSIEEGRRLGVDLVIKINELRHELFFNAMPVAHKSGLGISLELPGTSNLGSHSRMTSVSSNLGRFEELPERIVQHFKLDTMDDLTPEDEGIYFKVVLDANQSLFPSTTLSNFSSFDMLQN